MSRSSGKLLLLSMLATLLAGSAQAQAQEEGFSLYEKTIYPTMRHYCQECHTTEAIYPQGPAHSDKDPAVAFHNFKRFVKLDDPASSVVFKQLKNAHFCVEHQTNCGKEQEIRDRLEPAIMKWISAMNESASPAGSNATAFVVPNSTSFVAQFPLQVNGPTSGLSVALSFTQFMDREFKLVRAEVRGRQGTYRVSNVAFRVNGAPTQQATALDSVDQLINVDVFGGIEGRMASADLISAKPLIRLMPGDKITLTAQALPQQTPACAKPNAIESVIAPFLMNGVFGEANWIGLSTSEIRQASEGPLRSELIKALCVAYESRVDATRPSKSTVFTTATAKPDMLYPIFKAADKIPAIPAILRTIKVKDIALSSGGSNQIKCAISIDGEVFCFSSLDMSAIATERAKVAFPEKIIQVSIGNGFQCALGDSRSVYCWGQQAVYGYNYSSTNSRRLTFSSSAPSTVTTPLRLGFFDELGGDRVKQIASGDGHACALTEGGLVYCFGNNTRGQVGAAQQITGVLLDHPSSSVTQPNELQLQSAQGIKTTKLPLVLPEKMVKVAAAGSTTCVLGESGKIYCFGKGLYAENAMDLLPADGKNAIALKFRKPFKDLIISSPDNGAVLVCGLTAEREAFCAGENAAYSAGSGINQRNLPADAVDSMTKVKVASPIEQIVLGFFKGCALRADGEIDCYGYNLKQNFNLISPPPEKKQGLAEPTRIRWQSKPKKIAMGYEDMCAISSADELYCWGNGRALGVNPNLYELLRGKEIDLSTYTKVLLLKKQ